jgi:HlyD family secretion protein
MANLPSVEPLDLIKTDEFLPPVNRWVTGGSWFIVFALAGAVAASFSVSYRTTVKVPAIIRPVGEPRLVQASVTGNVSDIKVKENTPVKQGDIIAKLNTTSLEAQAVQLLANLDQGKSRLAQTDAQLISIDQQILAEANQAQRTVAASAADYSQIQRTNRNQGIAAEAAVQEAQAQIALAAKEAESYSQLVDSGAVSRLQLYEKQAALEMAQSRMITLQAALNPPTGEVQAAQERIAQAEAGGVATVARLQQSKQQLIQQGLEIQEQLQKTEQEIAQVNLSLKNSVLRSPITGTLYELSLRNTGQVVNPGETLAKVIPAEAPIEIKAMVPTGEINKVKVGMPAQMRVSACPFSEFGTLSGEVKAVSPDTIAAPSSSSSRDSSTPPPLMSGAFYSVLIHAENPTLKSDRTQQLCNLQPGSEGRVTIISRQETVITFLRRKAGLMTSF